MMANESDHTDEVVVTDDEPGWSGTEVVRDEGENPDKNAPGGWKGSEVVKDHGDTVGGDTVGGETTGGPRD